MSAEIVNFPGISRLDTPVSRIIERASEVDLEEIVVVGCGKDGGFYFAASRADAGDVLWALERAKHKLMMITDKLENGE